MVYQDLWDVDVDSRSVLEAYVLRDVCPVLRAVCSVMLTAPAPVIDCCDLCTFIAVRTTSCASTSCLNGLIFDLRHQKKW